MSNAAPSFLSFGQTDLDRSSVAKSALLRSAECSTMRFVKDAERSARNHRASPPRVQIADASVTHHQVKKGGFRKGSRPEKLGSRKGPLAAALHHQRNWVLKLCPRRFE